MILRSLGLAMVGTPALVLFMYAAYVTEHGNWKRALALFGVTVGVVAWMIAGVYLAVKW